LICCVGLPHRIPYFILRSAYSTCSGTKDVGSSAAKVAALEAAGIDEWKPSGSHKWDARSTEEMFALEDIGPSFRMWQECYAKDPIYRYRRMSRP